MADGLKTPGGGFAPVDPYALARNEAAALQIKRLYKEVATEPNGDGFAVLLDGRPTTTPKRRPLELPSEAAAGLVAAEFMAQGRVMRPGEMSVLRLVNSVIDGVAETSEAVEADVLRYVSADLVCYRADAPDQLVRLQSDAWDDVLAWARDQLQARFYLAEGVIHVAQPDHAIEAFGRGVTLALGEGRARPFRLGALHLMTTLTGSALLGLGVLSGHLSAEVAWAKAHVDEDFQTDRWGRDEEAEARKARRWTEMSAAERLVQALAKT